jgi:hypothetical protein
MLDVHVLTIPSYPAEFIAECEASIAAAVERAPFPVQVHVLAGEVGHIGRGRARGYALGTFPYVTCVDCDDYLLPDAFSNMADALKQYPSAVFTPERVLTSNGELTPGLDRHHLMVLKREHLIDHATWPVYGDLAQLYAIDGIQLDEPGYVWRRQGQHDSTRLRRRHPEMHQRLQAVRYG